MATILSFDTSGSWCTVAVLRDGDVLAEQTDTMARGQAERLMPLVVETIATAGLELADLDAIGVGVGPGNFTGIRLSVSAARGVSLSLGIAAIGVSRLEALALNGPRPMLALVDARRGAVYAQRFDVTGAEDPFLAQHPSDLPDDLPWVSDMPDHVPPHHALAPAIAQIAATRLDAPITAPAPLYIRAADAAPSRDVAPVILP